MQAARPVLNGGDEETYRMVTRLVPTQPGYRARLTAGVRRSPQRAGIPLRLGLDTPDLCILLILPGQSAQNVVQSFCT